MFQRFSYYLIDMLKFIIITTLCAHWRLGFDTHNPKCQSQSPNSTQKALEQLATLFPRPDPRKDPKSGALNWDAILLKGTL